MKTLKKIPKSLAILILLTTFLLFSCVKFKENPLDPTTPTGFLLNFIENQNNDQGSNQNQGYTPDKILLFPTIGIYDGNIKGILVYSSAREGIDTICRNEFNNVIRVTYAGYDNIQNVRGFISIDATDYLSNYPNLYNVPTNVPIMGPNPNNQNRLVANNWADLWSYDGNEYYIRNTLNIAIGLSAPWWSGSNINGSLADYNCNNWTDGSGYSGIYGDPYTKISSWINNNLKLCSNAYFLLCIAW